MTKYKVYALVFFDLYDPRTKEHFKVKTGSIPLGVHRTEREAKLHYLRCIKGDDRMLSQILDALEEGFLEEVQFEVHYEKFS